MRPISDINIGDQYQKNYPFNLIWYVLDIDVKEKMIKIEPYGEDGRGPINRPIWKRNTDSIFNRRIFNRKTNSLDI